ncbi:4'-phosphopantetheinyl transferase [Enterovibrio sp. FF113]|uniref:4'-phosphopantetheinyl transferase family protein n=1 Tax=Enterovibrio sp. FF113 TaxID=3230010 RepID=UPI00352F7D61
MLLSKPHIEKIRLRFSPSGHLETDNNRFITDVETSKEHAFPSVLLCRCQFDISQMSNQLKEHYDISVPNDIQQAVTKRKAEYLAGRVVSKWALERIGSKSLHVGRDEDRKPIFPIGFSGSISHSQNTAICVVTTNKHIKYVGIDVENTVTSKVANELKHLIASNHEFSLLRSSGLSINQKVTLIFSAKESLFKAIYPYANQILGFDSSSIISIKNNSLELKLRNDIADKIQSQSVFKCEFIVEREEVTTLVLS